MGYKLKCWQLTDIRTGHVTQVKAKSRRTLDRQLGRRANDVLIERCK
jgi:hypothetical protein